MTGCMSEFLSGYSSPRPGGGRDAGRGCSCCLLPYDCRGEPFPFAGGRKQYGLGGQARSDNRPVQAADRGYGNDSANDFYKHVSGDFDPATRLLDPMVSAHVRVPSANDYPLLVRFADLEERKLARLDLIGNCVEITAARQFSHLADDLVFIHDGLPHVFEAALSCVIEA